MADYVLSPLAARTFGALLLWAFVAYGGGDSWMVALRSKHLSTLSFGPHEHEVVSAGLLLLSNSVRSGAGLARWGWRGGDVELAAAGGPRNSSGFASPSSAAFIVSAPVCSVA